jgi:Ca2+-binding RTX toxin-like protein
MAGIKLDKNGNAIGKSGADTIYGNGKTNILGGMGGNDSLWGRGGHDLIDGGAGNDKIDGGAGNDILIGGSGLDTLVGGAGYDYFGFDSKLSSSNIDVIDDFSVKSDSILLSKKIFKVSADSKGYIKSFAFWTGSGAHDPNDRIIYDKTTGALYYDADGTGSKAAVQFAQLDANLGLTYKDFGIL